MPGSFTTSSTKAARSGQGRLITCFSGARRPISSGYAPERAVNTVDSTASFFTSGRAAAARPPACTTLNTGQGSSS